MSPIADKGYNTDDLWLKSKQIARSANQEYNWLEIVSFYNENGGKHVQVMTLLPKDDFAKRVLLVLDDNHVLLIDKEENLHVADYTEAFEGNKLFIFEEEPEPFTIKVPKGYDFPYEELELYK